MAKVYKSNNKFVIIIPNDVINALGIKEGDDLDFLEYTNSTYIIAKKNDLVKLLSKAKEEQIIPPVSTKVTFNRNPTSTTMSLEPRELEVLKKLDTMRYNDRTSSKVNSMLNASEKEVLQSLLKRKIVSPFKKPGEKDTHYSIQKSIYDAFLYRKGKTEQQPPVAMPTVKTQIPQKVQFQQKTQPVRQQQTAPKAWEQNLGNNAYMEMLETNGFIVLANEAEAAIVSSSLEDSIRQGLVLGTRAFNKKFYIALRGYINKNAPKIFKLIEQKSMNIEDIAAQAGIAEDGVRAILYVLSESGDIIEVRKDVFRMA